jgi:transcriptional regulator with XRE-family HTH domain
MTKPRTLEQLSEPTASASWKRRALADLLKVCRARVSPADVGLRAGFRRHTLGLRREDVATLAGISLTWYTWLEQGRAIHVSVAALERISTTLRMSPEEREYLFALVHHRPGPPLWTLSDEVTPSLTRMLHASAVPALVMTARWDVIAWNHATRIFRNYDDLQPCERNLLRILLVTDETYRLDPAQYAAMARRVLSKFRVDYSQAPNKAPFDVLIAELSSQSPVFRELWHSHEIMTRSEGVGHYPHLGGVSFEHSSYVPEGHPCLRLVTYVPHGAESAAKVAAWRDLQGSGEKTFGELSPSERRTKRPSTRLARRR